MERYQNKRVRVRGAGGRFRKVSAADFGIGGVCPKCRHFLVRVYDGDPKSSFVDPRAFRFRCFTCEPRTEEEIKQAQEKEAKEPKFSMADFFSKAVKDV